MFPFFPRARGLPIPDQLEWSNRDVLCGTCRNIDCSGTGGKVGWAGTTVGQCADGDDACSNAGDPERNAHKIGANTSTQNRGRTWTLAHQKALLRTVLDEECCFFEKVSNVEKNSAWKLLLERMRGSYPDLFGGWILHRNVVQRRLMDIIRLHRENEQEALRATSRGGGRADEEFAQLYEVSEKMEEAKARIGAEASQKNLAREEKERLGELLREHKLQRAGKRKR
eukprot:scaffold270_cov347-Pavlova_lutheri.AAC.1